MDDQTLKKVQGVMLQMATDVIDVCENNGIHYFLDGGTMLGAVRHKGFIPWDDDLDIGMLREDYNKFLSIAPEKLGKKYFVQTAETDLEYGFWFAKVRLENTVYEETAASKKSVHKGFYIDIFPYDHFPDDEEERKRTIRKIEFLKRALLAKTDYPIWQTNKGLSLKRLICYKLLRLLLLPVSKKRLYAKFEETATKWNSQDTLDVYPQGNSRCGRFHMQGASFKRFIPAQFETESLKILEDYDLFLKTLYGDYMTLPPESERGNRHNIKTIVFEED